MDSDSNKQHNYRVIVSEIIMVIAVIITVTVLAFIVSGYWINSDFEVERQGMLQVSSMPTGADVSIDNESSIWPQRTNTSKVISSGEHTVTLSKEGYDSWTKTINIQEGLLYRLTYPRLFLLNRSPEDILDTTGSINAFISTNHNSMIITNATTKWLYLDLRSSTIKPHTIDLFHIITGTDDDTTVFNGKILTAKWDYDAAHLLLQIEKDESVEWILLDVKEPTHSLNLTKAFSYSFDSVEILDNSSSRLLALQDGNLRLINVANNSITQIIAKQVSSFDHFDNEIVFSALTTPSPSSTEAESTPTTTPYYIGFLKNYDTKPEVLLHTATPTKVVISKFYDEKYFSTLTNNQINIYKLDDLSEFAHHDLTFSPESIKVGHNGEFITMSSGPQIATIDMEANKLREWRVEGTDYDWLDQNMIYTVTDGELIVYDFDGLNRRTLAKNVSHRLPIGITDNKWLYYFSDDHLIREWIVEH